MKIEDILDLFEKVSTQAYWGAGAFLVMYSDGSGRVCSDDDDTLFFFESPEELFENLKELA